jgi:hypothetical protein
MPNLSLLITLIILVLLGLLLISWHRPSMERIPVWSRRRKLD